MNFDGSALSGRRFRNLSWTLLSWTFLASPPSLAVEPGPTQGQPPAPLTSGDLVLDVWPGPIVEEFNFALPFSFPATELLESGGLVFFPFLEPAHGRELWRTDGTPDGTFLVRDVTPGRDGAIEMLSALRGGVLFAAGSELWWSGGSPIDTELLVRLVSPPVSAPSTGSRAFFRGCNETSSGCGLWVTDGTRRGTRPLTTGLGSRDGEWEIAPTLDSAGRVYFSVSEAQNGSARLFLYSLQDDTLDTLLEGSDPFENLVVAGESLVFLERRAGTRATVWQSDGTREGTSPVLTSEALQLLPASLGATVLALESRPGPGCRLLALSGSTRSDLADLPNCPETGNAVVTGQVLRLVDSTSRLWRSDGTAAGTFVEAEDLPSPSFVATPRGLVFVRRQGLGPTWGSSLLLLTPTGPKTSQREVLADGLHQVGAVASLDEEIVFTGGPVRSPQDLWTSDGTASGTRVAVPLGIGAGGPIAPSHPRELGRSGNEVVFLADDSPIHHPDPWRTDGRPVGTFRLAEDGRLLESSGPPPDLSPFARGALWRRAATPYPEPNLWILDPLTGFAERFDDLRESRELFSLEVDGGLLFSAQTTNGHGGTLGGGLFLTNGTLSGTTKVSETAPSNLLSAAGARFDRHVYFDLFYGGPIAFIDEALYRLDLDDGVPELIEGFPPYRLASDLVDDLVATPERLFLVSSVTTAGRPPLEPDDPFPSGDSLLVLELGQDRLQYASVPDSIAARSEGLSLDLRSPVAFRGRLALRVSTIPESGEPPPVGDRLVLTDGSAGRDLAVLAPTPFDSDWSSTPVGDLLYFTPLTPNAGRELWVSDGTEEGTRLLADLATGPESAAPHALTALGGQLLFAASTPRAGSELWTTDGSAEGTVPVLDLADGQESGDPAEPTALGEQVVFSGHRRDVGRELFSFDRRVLEPSCSAEIVSGSVCLGAGRFRVSVDWLDRVSGDHGRAVGSSLSRDTASFWFFDEENVELLVKVLDGRWINDAFWVYSGAVTDVAHWVTVFDTVTGETKTYESRQGTQCGFGDVGALPEDREIAALFGRLEPLTPADPPTAGTENGSATCQPSKSRLCLQDGRFAVSVDWKTSGGETDSGTGFAVPATTDSGYFWFFSPENVELVIKVLDGRSANDRFWVYYGALSDVEYEITVTDTASGARRIYHNQRGSQCGGADVDAFVQ